MKYNKTLYNVDYSCLSIGDGVICFPANERGYFFGYVVDVNRRSVLVRNSDNGLKLRFSCSVIKKVVSQILTDSNNNKALKQ